MSALLEGVSAGAAFSWLLGMAFDAFGSAASLSGSWPSGGSLPSHAWVALTAGVLLGACRLRRSHMSARRLAWDGHTWRHGGHSGSARVAVDLLGWMLVRFQSDDGSVMWVPLSEAGAGAAWPSIRAALYWSESPAAAQVFRDQTAGSVT